MRSVHLDDDSMGQLIQRTLRDVERYAPSDTGLVERVLERERRRRTRLLAVGACLGTVIALAAMLVLPAVTAGPPDRLSSRDKLAGVSTSNGASARSWYGLEGGQPAQLSVPTVTTLRQPYIVGASADTHLTLTPAGTSGRLPVSAQQAIRKLAHAYIAYAQGPFVLFTLAKVTQSGGSLGGPAAPMSDLAHRILWTGVWEYNFNNSVAQTLGCGGLPPGDTTSPASGVPPVYVHYFFAVLVDAYTGELGVWMEDQSGRVLRRCP